MNMVDDLNTLLPGPEMDRLIELHVFCRRTAQKWVRSLPDGRALFVDLAPKGEEGLWFVEQCVDHGKGRFERLRKWSSDPAEAMLLLDHLRKTRMRVEVGGDHWEVGGSWQVRILDQADFIHARGMDSVQPGDNREPSLPLAICRAALAVVQARGTSK